MRPEADRRRRIPHERRLPRGAARADAESLCADLRGSSPRATRSPKGRISAVARGFRSDLDECLALWIPSAPIRGLRWPPGCASFFQIVAGSPSSCIEARTTPERLARLQRARSCHGPAAGRGRRCAHACQRTTGAAGHGHCDSPSLHARGSRASVVSERRAASAEPRGAGCDLSARSARGDCCASRSAANSPWPVLRYNYPRELVAGGHDACEHLRNLTEAGTAQALAGRSARRKSAARSRRNCADRRAAATSISF